MTADPDHPLQGRRVLLVEDNAADLYVYKTTLARAGAEVTGVTDAASAVALLECGRPFDAVVLDFGLPGMRGTAAAARLRSGGFGGAIVGVSAALADDIVELWLAAGCDAVAVKMDGGLKSFVRTVADACDARRDGSEAASA